MPHPDFVVSDDEFEDSSDIDISPHGDDNYDVDNFSFDDQDFLPHVDSLDDNRANAVGRSNKKRGRKPLSISTGSRSRRNDMQLRAMLEDSANLASFALQGRRSRRMRPIDGNKELIVLMPNDDPISKLQLEKNEIPEFVYCLEEKFDWVLEDEKLAEGEGFGKGHGGRGGESHASVPLPEGAEVHVPESRVNEAHYKSLQKKQVPFVLPPMGSEGRSSLYASYDLDNDDEDFLKAWTTGKPLVMLNNESHSGFVVLKNGSIKSRKGLASGGGGSVPLNEMALGEMLVGFEREYELLKGSASMRSEINDAKFKCQEYMNSCSELADRAESFKGGREEIAALEKDFSVHQERVDIWHARLDRSNSLVSLRSVKSDMSDSVQNDDEKSIRPNVQPDLTELPIVTWEELEATLSAEWACKLVARIYRVFYPHSDTTAKRTAQEDELLLRPYLILVYEYWLNKRSARRSSLLRCYHNFIMENWKPQSVLPMLSEDRNTEDLLKAHTQLVKLRHDLDRARLIMDRVRRREKVKKELVRVAGDTTDDFIRTLKIVNSDAKDSKELSVDVKFEKTGGKTKESNNVRQPRAAKALALVKLDSNSSVPSESAAPIVSSDSGFDSDIIPFALEDCDYDKLELPANSSSFGVAGSVETLPSRDSRSAAGSAQGYYSDYDPRRANQRNPSKYNPASSPQGNAGTGWTADEDRLLLMGVASCGVGRWTEIREDFLLARNSAQMNQRFTRLARRRCVLVKINSNASNKRGNGEDTPEYTEVRTAFMSQQDVHNARSKLPPLIISMLEEYSEDNIWESIALRHLVDMQSKDKRCGRPQKYPLPIPIPKHLQNGGFMSRRKNIIQRPSELGYNWKGRGVAAGAPEGVYEYGASYSRGGYSQSASSGSSVGSPKKRARGRPKKSANDDESNSGTRKKTRSEVAVGTDYDDMEQDLDDDMMSISSGLSIVSEDWKTNSAKQQVQSVDQKRIEQGLSREERSRARERKAELKSMADMGNTFENSSESCSDDEESGGRSGPARCSLGNLSNTNASKKDKAGAGKAAAKRGRGRPPGSVQVKETRKK